MRRVLACVDLTESSDRVLACARALTEPEGELVILHVAAPEPDFVGYCVGPQSVREAGALELRNEHRQVQQLAAACAATCFVARAAQTLVRTRTGHRAIALVRAHR
jgi:hypothetical protein